MVAVTRSTSTAWGLVALLVVAACSGEPADDEAHNAVADQAAADAGAAHKPTNASSGKGKLLTGKVSACFEGGRLPGRVLTDAECACVVKIDDRPFSPGKDLSNAPLSDPDPRANDPTYKHWTQRVRSTHCACCHSRNYKGSGSPYWDLGHTPIWWDSLTDRRMRIIADPDNKPGQTLPLEATDLTAMRAFVEVEIKRREDARKAAKKGK